MGWGKPHVWGGACAPPRPPLAAPLWLVHSCSLSSLYYLIVTDRPFTRPALLDGWATDQCHSTQTFFWSVGNKDLLLLCKIVWLRNSELDTIQVNLLFFLLKTTNWSYLNISLSPPIPLHHHIWWFLADKGALSMGQITPDVIKVGGQAQSLQKLAQHQSGQLGF